MLDYWKVWIYDDDLIQNVLQNKTVGKCFETTEEGVLRGIQGSFGEWKIQTLSNGCLQITGSLHKYWNGGTNENDFSFWDACQTINRFCNSLELPPDKLFVKNLEFGLNLQPAINASEIMDGIICFKNLQPIRPYNKRPDCYFMEFEQWDYFLKVYDKGKQYASKLPGTPNILRLEIKGMNSRYLQKMGIRTAAELTNTDTLQVLGWKIEKTLKGLVLDDGTINPKKLPPKERRLYLDWRNPRRWKAVKGATSAAQRKIADKFRQVVAKYGSHNIYHLLYSAVSDKIRQLSTLPDGAFFQPNLYVEKPPEKLCATCGRDISHQKTDSRYCGEKTVGYQQAHRCRNKASNPRNNLKRKLAKITSRGLLFDITPFFKCRTG